MRSDGTELSRSERVLAQLQRDVQYLKDRLAITDRIARHARGHDRHDTELMTSSYWEDAVDEHGHAINPGPKYAAWANAAHSAGSLLHTHNVTTHLCDIVGDVAHCESYVIVGLLDRGGNTARFISGRYIDRIERRHDEWKIALRRSIVDLMICGDASMLKNPLFTQQGYTKGAWDESDLSYQRPLSLEKASVQQW